MAIYNADGGHAMIVYKVDADTGTLYIADPNYPGDSSRKVQYADGAFAPYNSGANKAEIDAGDGEAYDEICCFAKTAIIPWSQIAARWDEFDQATIGEGIFPAYTIEVLDDSGGVVLLTDGMVISGDKLDLVATSPDPAHLLWVSVYRGEERLPFDSNFKVDLLEGDNRLGIYVVGEVAGDWEYVDFQWVTLRRTGAGYIQLGISIHGYWEYVQPDTYNPDTELPGLIDYSEDLLSSTNTFMAYAGRSMINGLFRAQWSNFSLHVGDQLAEGPYPGGMSVQFSDDMSEVLWFYASDSQSIGGIDGWDHIWFAGATNIPLYRTGNGFYEYKIEGAECCNHINALSNDWAYNSSNNTTHLTHYICDIYSEIGVIWYEEAPPWMSPQMG